MMKIVIEPKTVKRPWKTREKTVKAREKPVILSDFSVANIFKKKPWSVVHEHSTNYFAADLF